MTTPLRAALLAAMLCAGCLPREDQDPPPGDSEVVRCEPTFVGEVGSAPEMQIVHRTAAGEQVDGGELGPVELFLPPQGGKVFLTGARVRNVDACGLRIEAWLRDECTGRIIGLEGRPYQTRVEDGWLVPLRANTLSSWANVPACPSQAAERRIDGEVYELTVRVTDVGGRRAVASQHVVPRCAEPAAYRVRQCRCECGPDYELGDTCEGGDDDLITPGDSGIPVLDCPGSGGDP